MKKLLVGIIALLPVLGEAQVVPQRHFHATTATPGTAYALTTAAQTTFVATTPNFSLRNNGGSFIQINYVKLELATQGTGGTRFETAVVLDTITRYSSGGQALVAYNINAEDASGSGATNLFAGAITATAASAPRYICRGAITSVNPAIGVQYGVVFKHVDNVGSVAGNTTTVNCPPAVVGPGDSFLVYIWLPGQSVAPTGEMFASWHEGPLVR